MKQVLLVFYTYGTSKWISDIKEEEIKNPACNVNVLAFVKFLPKGDFPKTNLVSLEGVEPVAIEDKIFKGTPSSLNVFVFAHKADN